MSGKMFSTRIWAKNEGSESSTNLTHICLEETMFPFLLDLIVSLGHYCRCSGLNQNGPHRLIGRGIV